MFEFLFKGMSDKSEYLVVLVFISFLIELIFDRKKLKSNKRAMKIAFWVWLLYIIALNTVVVIMYIDTGYTKIDGLFFFIVFIVAILNTVFIQKLIKTTKPDGNS